MVTDLRIPEGIVVRTAKGGPDSLKEMLADLRKYSFTGYVKVTLDKDIMSSVGFLVVERGDIVMAVYEFEKSKPRELKRIYTGEKSLRFIHEDSQDKGASIELHSRVPTVEFERRFPDAKVTEERTVAPPEEERKQERVAEEEVRDPRREMIEHWRRKGFRVESLEEALAKGPDALAKELEAFERDCMRLKQFEVILNNFPVLGHEQEIADIRAKLDDRMRIAEIESDIEFLQEKIRRRIQKRKAEEESIKHEMEKKKHDEKVADVYDLILKYQTTTEEPEGEHRCPRCGGELDDEGACPRCSAEGPGEPVPAYSKPLPPDMTFSSFVVGPGSKFPAAAAASAADSPGKAYNPLFIFGGTGLGKTHLLSAIGHRVVQKDPKAKILYVPADRFVDAIAQAGDAAMRRRIREDLQRVDLLLVDDFQFLAASQEAQAEIVAVIDSLMEAERQVVLASDRLPSQIPDLIDRLSTRIVKGLTADIQPPDLETREKILRLKAKEKKLRIGDDIVTYIAERVTTNVRELESAVNKIIAFSTIMKLDVDLNMVSDILKPLAPVQETRKEIMKEVKVLPGHCYLIEEERPVYSNVLLARKQGEGYRGLVITRLNPRRVREDLKVDARILWLTDKESTQEKTIPPSLEMIIHTIQGFVGEGERGFVVIDGLQYLISNTSFDAVLRFIRSLIDELSETTCVLAISLSPDTLKSQELAILEREMEVVDLA